jgi:hypothetical protein
MPVAKRRAVIALAALLLSSASLRAAFSSDGSTLHLGAQQTLTVAGSFTSLRALIEDICWRAGVELRSFDAEDRSVNVNYSGIPLANALRGLLRNESYLLGAAPAPSHAVPQITWIRVLGEHETARTNRRRGRQQAAAGFQVPSTLVRTAFASEDGDERAAALQEISARILSSDEQLAAFLATEAHLIARTLNRYPHAAELVSELRESQIDPTIRRKLDEIIAALRG